MENYKNCCERKNLIFDCIEQEEWTVYYQAVEIWLRTGKVEPNFSKITFTCANCQEFYDKFLDNPCWDMKQLAEVGCCKTISIIRNLDGKVEIFRLEQWLKLFEDIACPSCLNQVKLALLERQKELIEQKKWKREGVE